MIKNNLWPVFGLLSYILFSLGAKADHFQMKAIISNPQVTLSDATVVALKKDLHLHKDFKLKTTKNQFAKISLGHFFELSVFGDSEVEVSSKDPAFPDEGFLVNLVNGQIYVHSIDSKEIKNIKKPELRLKSDFFDWVIDQNTDPSKEVNLSIKINRETPSISFCNKQKPFEISLFEHEKKILLDASEGIIFQGKNQNEGAGLSADKSTPHIAYDILLNGRKIPKGEWLEKSKCSFDDLTQLENSLIQKEADEKAKHNARTVKIKTQKSAQDSKFLCHKPYGQLNDCAWILSGKSCVRTRCDAEGKWTDRAILSIQKSVLCTAEYQILPCGY